jgi:hypothetical protein
VFKYTTNFEIYLPELYSFFIGLPTIFCDIVQESRYIPREERVKNDKILVTDREGP